MAPPLPSYPWYAIVSGHDIQQGDLLEKCPVFSPPEKIDEHGISEVLCTRRDVIVMTQSCDLSRVPPPSEILLCEAFQRSQLPPKIQDNLENIRKGNMPAFHLLNECNEEGFRHELMVVDFRRVFSLPFGFLRGAANLLHLRLLPPYREHLSQSFARYFMRVGLPVDIPRLK